MEDCRQVITTINQYALNEPCEGEYRAFFQKLTADYYRYIAEFASGMELEQVKLEALRSYEEADEIDLHPNSPLKLGLSLNFAVFHYEVMKNPTGAIEIAEKTLLLAKKNVEVKSLNDFQEAESIIEQLEHNLILWKSSSQSSDNE